MYFKISAGNILVTCDASKYLLTIVTLVIKIQKLIKSTKKAGRGETLNWKEI